MNLTEDSNITADTQTVMCGGRPCFTSVCGLSLQKSVIVIGILELLITVIATILNIIKYARSVGAFDEDYR